MSLFPVAFTSIFLSTISSVHSQGCLLDCYECPTETQCAESISMGNDCVWTHDFCERIPIDAQSAQATSASSNLHREDCFCTKPYYISSSIPTQQSCDCNGSGMKSVTIQYNGNHNDTPSYIAFYHDTSLHIGYQECTFNDVAPGQSLQCTSFPYTQFESTITIVAVSNDDEILCKSIIDTSCSSDILGVVSPEMECADIDIVGWIDVAHYQCGVGNRRRFIERNPGRRLLSSSSSSDSSSGGSTKNQGDNKKDKETKTEPIPEEESPVVPLSTTPSPTTKSKNTQFPIFYDTTSTTLETSTSEGTTSTLTTSGNDNAVTTGNGQSVSTTSSSVMTTESDLTTTAVAEGITNAYCHCESEESWDDFHYYDEQGALVILSNEYQAEANILAKSAVESNLAVQNEKVVSAADMISIMHSKSDGAVGKSVGCLYVVCVALFVLMVGV